MSHIFISYSHKDSEYAHQLAQKLEQVGWPVWIDDRIDYSASWTHVIQENLDNCAVFIVIMTPRAYQSTWVQNELSRAQRIGKPIFPLLLAGDGPWLSVEATQYTNVSNGRLPPERFFDDLKQVFIRSEGAAKPGTKAEPEAEVRSIAPPDRRGPRTDLLVAIFFCLIGMFAWNVVLIISKATTSGDGISIAAFGLVGLLVTGSGISREGKRRTRRAQQSWSPPSIAVQPFRLTPSFESGIFGGLIGGAIAGLIIGVVYHAENPDAEWAIIPQVFIYAAVAGSFLGASTQLTILWFRHLATERQWSAAVFNEVTGGLLGSAVMGIPVGALLGWQFFPRGSALVSADLLVAGAVLGAIFIVLGALLYSYEGRLRYVVRAVLSSFMILAVVYALGNPTFQALLQTLLRAAFLQPCIAHSGDLIDPTGFCYTGLGAFMGVCVGIILGLQIGLTLWFYRFWEALR